MRKESERVNGQYKVSKSWSIIWQEQDEIVLLCCFFSFFCQLLYISSIKLLLNARNFLCIKFKIVYLNHGNAHLTLFESCDNVTIIYEVENLIFSENYIQVQKKMWESRKTLKINVTCFSNQVQYPGDICYSSRKLSQLAAKLLGAVCKLGSTALTTLLRRRDCKYFQFFFEK